jgi:methyl-accepting chemotaxis protein
MILNIKNWKLKNKILVMCLSLSIVPIIVSGSISYILSSNSIFGQIREKLEMQVQVYKNSITSSLKDAGNEMDIQKSNAKNIITQQANMLIRLLDASKKVGDGKMKDVISEFKVGKTGYVFILDYNGRYILSGGHLRDGENIIDAKDDTGRFFVADIIKKGLSLSDNDMDYDEYFWKNAGEKNAREKIAAIIHVPSRKWIVGVSAYYDDLVDMNIVEKKIAEFRKNILSEKVGLTGYMFVLNSRGDIIIHPKQEGDNVFKYDFVKKMCADKSGGYIRYDWEGRPKVVAYDYYAPEDWIIASGSYLSDFTGNLVMIRNTTIAVIASAMFLIILIAFLFTSGITRTLNSVIMNLNNGSLQIVTASNQLSSSSQEIAGSATEQASSIEETTSSMEELASMVKQNSQNAGEASSLSEKASAASHGGVSQMEKMMESMNEINRASGNIKKIIKVINDIAFQTNILALNAAVEAARAGEAGLGFAIVADEVKNLATRSAEAARETNDMITGSILKIEEGLKIADQLTGVFNEILINVGKVTEMVKEVESSSKQQDTGINEINKVIIKFDESIQVNASSAEETAKSAEELLSQVESLNLIVNQIFLLVNGNGKKYGLNVRSKTGQNNGKREIKRLEDMRVQDKIKITNENMNPERFLNY